MRPPLELLVLMLAALMPPPASAAKTAGYYPNPMMPFDDDGYCLGWRVGVESNNVRYFHTVPPQCVAYVEDYMLGGQYDSDVAIVMEQVFAYLADIAAPADDGKDAWILDVDDTCISNLMYYQRKRFGGEPYDPAAFRSWAGRGMCQAIPAVLRLYRTLVGSGFKVFLVTGRDDETLRPATSENLFMQGFMGHERLIMRNGLQRGLGAVMFKSSIRRQLESEGYRIRGNVGDQWSDLMGDCVGDRAFKLPNPMYFVP